MTVGIPVPPGVLRDANAVQLIDSAGQPLPVQTQATGVWPDGSVRWLLVEAIAPASAKPGDKLSLASVRGRRRLRSRQSKSRKRDRDG